MLLLLLLAPKLLAPPALLRACLFVVVMMRVVMGMWAMWVRCGLRWVDETCMMMRMTVTTLAEADDRPTD